MCLCNFCFAQTDTSIVYLAKDAHETSKDSAYSLIKFYKQNNMWHGKEYYLKKGGLKSEGDYGDKSAKTPIGDFKNYTETGKLDFTASYNNGKPNEVTYYYKSGSKKSWAAFDDKGIKQQKGWDEAGKEIKNFIVMREATFKGGMEGWRKYLEKNLNANVAADAGAPPGQYTVELTFKVSAEGYTSNVKATSVPNLCKPCGNEAVQVILNSREWQPAILQNEPVEYLAKQFVTFVVSESKNKKKKD
jgi:hypothetical protein